MGGEEKGRGGRGGYCGREAWGLPTCGVCELSVGIKEALEGSVEKRQNWQGDSVTPMVPKWRYIVHSYLVSWPPGFNGSSFG